MLSDTVLARLVQDFYALGLEVDDHVRLLGTPPDEELQQFRNQFLDEQISAKRAALGRSAFPEADFHTSIVLKRSGIDPETLGVGEFNQIRQAVLRASIDLAQALRARNDGDFCYEPKDKLLRLNLEPSSSRRGALDGAPECSGELAVRPSSPSVALAEAPRFSAVAEAFRREQHVVKIWDAQTTNQAGATYRLFIEVCGDRPLSGYTRADADHFRRSISVLPATYSKAVQYRGLTVPEILKMAKAESSVRDVPRLNQRTIKRHFSTLSALWSSAVSAGSAQGNIFAGFRFASAKRPRDQRPMWTTDELKQLFSSPLWVGCRSEARRTEPGRLVVRDEYYWIPLIALFSGMRQEEICQLHVEDLKEADGVVYFDVNDRPPRKLKNATAARKVPVHPVLIRLGLLDHVAACKRAGTLVLFPGLARGGADGRLGHAFSKWFTRYRKTIGLYRSGLDFHAFRHTASTLMHQGGVETMVIDHVTGHATPGETSRYTKGSSMAQLIHAISQISCDLGLQPATLGTPVCVRPPHRVKRRRRSPQTE